MARRKIVPGDTIRVVGGRRFIQQPGEVIIGQMGEWFVVQVPHWSKDGWVSCKIFRDMKGPKNLWQVGFKGGRAARNRSSRLLKEHYPGVLEQVAAVVSEWESRSELN